MIVVVVILLTLVTVVICGGDCAVVLIVVVVVVSDGDGYGDNCVGSKGLFGSLSLLSLQAPHRTAPTYQLIKVAPGMTLISVNLVLWVVWPFLGVQCYSVSGGSPKTCLL